MKKRKIIIPTVLALLALIIVLALILSRCDTQPEETLYGSTHSSSATGSTSSTGAEIPGSSAAATTAPTSAPATNTPSSAPTASSTAPTQSTGSTKPATKPTSPTTVPTQPTTKPNGCSHAFTEWEYEEYTYKQQGVYPDTQWHDRVSHRKVRSCTKCGYKETDGTANHYCAKGSSNHTVTTVKEGTCTSKAIMRSTCKICGWCLEYEGKKGDHTVKTETRHLTNYGTYTNELDANVQTCTSCGATDVTYALGEGWSDYNRYRVPANINQGSAYSMTPVTGDTSFLDHPEWQTVKRYFVHDSDGYVKQFTLYWWYNGSRYSQVINCGEGQIEAWFAEYGLTATSANSRYTLRIYGTEVRPYKLSYSG
ncbi:MAG: hypothetical protein E7455_09835 [Ruminococcaceae bacterium]|nr:hypothetical protein [Oscillospiraceae bacterium]